MVNNPQNNAVVYGQQALSWVDRLTIRRRIALARALIDQSRRAGQPVSTVIELGCGYHGTNLRLLSELYPEVTFCGVDLMVSDQPIPRTQLEAADISQWQPAERYDVVLSLAVVEHLIEPLAHFDLIRRCLQPGGIALLTSPTPANHTVWSGLARLGLIHVAVDDHKLYLTRAGIADLAAEAGLSLVQYRSFQAGLNQYAWLKCADQQA